MSFDVLKKIEELKKSDMICAEGRYELVKAEVLEILLRCGVHYKRAIKTIDMFSDPEQVALESKARMENLYPDKVEDSNDDNNNITTAGE